MERRRSSSVCRTSATVGYAAVVVVAVVVNAVDAATVVAVVACGGVAFPNDDVVVGVVEDVVEVGGTRDKVPLLRTKRRSSSAGWRPRAVEENKSRGVDVAADVADAVVVAVEVRARKMRSFEERTCEAKGRKRN